MTILVYLLTAFCIFTSIVAKSCPPDSIFIRQQHIDKYAKLDGTIVNEHTRSEHCRKTVFYYSFSNTTTLLPAHKKIEWKKGEIEEINKLIERLPTWLKIYTSIEFIKLEQKSKNDKNPAITIPGTKNIFVLDSFFKNKNKLPILIHEFSHIALWDIPYNDLKSVLLGLGWKLVRGQKPIAPEKLLLEDSIESPSEDLANHIELYYTDPNRLKKFNSDHFEIIKKLVQKMERN